MANFMLTTDPVAAAHLAVAQNYPTPCEDTGRVALATTWQVPSMEAIESYLHGRGWRRAADRPMPWARPTEPPLRAWVNGEHEVLLACEHWSFHLQHRADALVDIATAEGRLPGDVCADVHRLPNGVA